MRRSAVRTFVAALATAAVVAAGVALSTTNASAATGGVTGYATQNGGTTGGAGGQTVRATTGTAIHAALCNRASSSTPIIIEVEGTINHGNTTKVSRRQLQHRSRRDRAQGDQQRHDHRRRQRRRLRPARHPHPRLQQHHHPERDRPERQEVRLARPPTAATPSAWRASVRNVWVDHVTLEASGGESEGYDGLFDMKDNTQYVTLSYSILRNSGRGGLVGSSESDTVQRLHHVPPQPVREHRLAHARCCAAASRTSTTTTT